MTLSRREREKIEQNGVPYSVAAILNAWEDITLDNISMVTEKWEQFKGIDYILSDDNGHEIYIDTKFHKGKMYKQSLTDHGVNILSVEIMKANGNKGWGINKALKTDYIVEVIGGIYYYVIDAKKLHEYMEEHYTDYPTIYSNKGHEDYRGVPVADLINNAVIVYYAPWEDIEETALSFSNGSNEIYNNKIIPLLDGLITGR